MDQDAVEARIERLFKEAKPRPKPKNHYLKLAAALILVTIPLSITQQPGLNPSTEPPIIQATAEAQAPTIRPTVLEETDETLTIKVNQPSTVFFCGCAHARAKAINAFSKTDRINGI